MMIIYIPRNLKWENPNDDVDNKRWEINGNKDEINENGTNKERGRERRREEREGEGVKMGCCLFSAFQAEKREKVLTSRKGPRERER